MLTSRDEQVIEFLQQLKVARASTLIRLHYPSERVGRRRLRAMVEDGEIKRARSSSTEEFVYYLQKPQQIKHACAVTDFYAWLAMQADIEKFRIEPDYEVLRPDAVFIYNVGGERHLGVLEVELSNKPLDTGKYTAWQASGAWQRKLPVWPEVWLARRSEAERGGAARRRGGGVSFLVENIRQKKSVEEFGYWINLKIEKIDLK